MRYLIIFLVNLILLSISPNNFAQNHKTCQSIEYRAFDFWVGDWSVRTKEKDKAYAVSHITLTNNGCSIAEDYTTVGGYHGNILSFYDFNYKKLHQTRIDNSG